MIGQHIKALAAWLRRVVTQPREELDRWQRAARFAYDLFRYGGRQLQHDRAPQMAGALAFRTLFALVPVLIVAMIVVKAMRGGDGFLDLTSQVFTAANLDDVRIVLPTEVGADGPNTSMTLADWLQGLVEQATQVNLTAVGWVGVALIIYAALGLMMTIENGFNTIYRASQGRAWTHRVPLFWFVLTMSPVAIGIMLYVNTFVADAIESVQAGQWLLTIAGTLWNLLIAWLVMFAIYSLLPNTNVALRPAAAGAAVAAILLEIGKHSLGAYLDNAFAISQLYGSLGLIPLFMFWVYLMWLAVLFGLEVSAILQALHGRDLEEMQPKPAAVGLLDPAAIIPVMEIVAERFAGGQPTTARHAAEVCSLPEEAVAQMYARLIEQRVLYSVDAGANSVSLALPADKVSAERLMQIGFELVDEPAGHKSEFVKRLREAQQALARQTTLATLVAGKG